MPCAGGDKPPDWSVVSKAPGRDAREAMERLVRLATRLHHAGERGVPTTNLLEVAGWTDSADGVSALSRDFRYLRALGWEIDNVGGTGLGGVYRMRTVDNRLRVKLTPSQQAALRRAVLLVGRGDLADRLGLSGGSEPAEVVATVKASDHAALDTVLRAVRQRSLLHFRYKGTERAVHPGSVQTYTTTWYLRGREEGSDLVKTYVVARMLDVHADDPGTAERVDLTRGTGLHPMGWQIDPPVDVTVRTSPEYVDDVRRWLGEPASVVEVQPAPVVEVRAPASLETTQATSLDLTYRVTNRAAFRARIYQLGTRVQVVGPDDVRQELLDELATMAGE
jgi:predicted DNA-binding transcriptional regulator YafY